MTALAALGDAPGRVVRLTRADARRALWRYHFTPDTVAGVARRLGSIQYDPLAPLGRNPDLVLQARVPGYRIDDWQGATYCDRLLLDAWDKQVCLTLTDDWPARHVFHSWFAESWRARVFEPHADAVRATLEELDARGPLGTLDFSDQSVGGGLRGSWYGPKLVKHVLRALWDSGQVVTHAREKGRHVYDLPARSLPEEVVRADPLPVDAAWTHLVSRRVQAAGMLRPNADASVWFMPGRRSTTNDAVRRATEGGAVRAAEVEGVRFLAFPELLRTLDDDAGTEGVRFLAPLDPLVWDRRGVAHLYGFEYVWEVYKPEVARRWGYYVLPVLWQERFVARFDARTEGDVLAMRAWHWEDDVARGALPAGLEEALEDAAVRFLAYLGATSIRLPRGMGRSARGVWQRAVARARRGDVPTLPSVRAPVGDGR